MKDLNEESTMSEVAEFVDWINHNIIKSRTRFWLKTFRLEIKPESNKEKKEKIED